MIYDFHNTKNGTENLSKLTKRYSIIDKPLARHFKYNGAGLEAPSLSMQSNNYNFF